MARSAAEPLPFEYTLIRSARRSLAIEVKDGQVIVRVPRLTPQSEARRFVIQYQEKVLEHLRRQAALPRPAEPGEAEVRALRQQAREILPDKIAHYAALLGVRPTRLTITSARTRFGSCSAKGGLSFSWRLLRYPEAAIDYVVLHEVAHLVHLNHSRDFYRLIETHMPDYRQRKALLRQPPL